MGRDQLFCFQLCELHRARKGREKPMDSSTKAKVDMDRKRQNNGFKHKIHCGHSQGTALLPSLCAVINGGVLLPCDDPALDRVHPLWVWKMCFLYWHLPISQPCLVPGEELRVHSQGRKLRSTAEGNIPKSMGAGSIWAGGSLRS